MVIVILGALSSIAIPKFIDLGDQARLSALRTTAASISAGSAINSVAFNAGNPGAAQVSASIVCQAPILLGRFMSNKDFNANYKITPDPASSQDCSPASGNSTISCIITDKQSLQSMPMVIYCAALPA